MYKKPRGTVDIYGNEGQIFFALQYFLSDISQHYGFTRIETPIFEEKKLFARSKDETSDMVTKEMYTFVDKGNRELALRPEGTAPVVRFVTEEKILDKEKHPLKYYYISPMFRYERPQSGRQRQFYQYGIECIAIDSIYDEIDVILLANQIVQDLHVANCVLKINYLGSLDTRKKWINELKKYFSQYKSELTDDSQKRIDTNPLRILDDKIDGTKSFVKDSPKIDKYLSEKELKEIQEFKKILDQNKIAYEWDSKIVRGLDYYTGIVFEIITKDNNLTIVGGGRYENIFSEIGSKDFRCFGFAIGIERLLLAINPKKLDKYLINNNIYFANLCSSNSMANEIINNLRSKGFSIVTSYSSNKLKSHFKFSEKYHPKLILIFGDNEKDNSEVIIKNQLNNEQKTISLKELEKELEKEIR
ncbi:MAG: histidine--tRNA ligase [Mycoplasmoidaceae bacterium]